MENFCMSIPFLTTFALNPLYKDLPVNKFESDTQIFNVVSWVIMLSAFRLKKLINAD
jgi:hypothetical protein